MPIRRRTALLLAVAFLSGGLLAGPGARMLAPHLASAYASEGSFHGDKAKELALFGQVLARVQADYVEPVSTETLIHHAMDGMISGLDPHSGYLDEKQWHEMQVETRGQFGGLGMTVTGDGGMLKVISPIDATPAARAGVKPGDLITAVDGKTVEGLTLEQAVEKLRGPPNTKVRVTIKRGRNDNPIELTLTREIIHMDAVKGRLFGDIGYVRLAEFNDEAEHGLRAAIIDLRKADKGNLRGIVLDLRNNPGGLLDEAVGVADDLLGGGTIVSTKGRHPEDNEVWRAKPGDLTNGLPIVVLINNGSASASEIVAGALQDNHRALLLGTRSFGKGSVQTLFPLKGEGAIRLTTARYYTPDGRSIQGEGIIPDVVVQASDSSQDDFGPAHESNLNNTISNSGGVSAVVTRRPEPAIAEGIAEHPPQDWPKLDPDKPATDYQLQEALVLVRRMAGEGSATTPGRHPAAHRGGARQPT